MEHGRDDPGDLNMQIPILSGIYADSTGEFRTSYPRNMVPVPKSSGIAEGYLAPGDGIAAFASGPGTDRGGFNWEGVLYRVMGTKLVRVARDGGISRPLMMSSMVGITTGPFQWLPEPAAHRSCRR